MAGRKPLSCRGDKTKESKPLITKQPYIGFEGPIGAGKTTLAQLLAGHLGATLVLEQVDDNQFLPDVYDDRQRWALPMQLWFLVARHHHITTVLAIRDRPVVAG